MENATSPKYEQTGQRCLEKLKKKKLLESH